MSHPVKEARRAIRPPPTLHAFSSEPCVTSRDPFPMATIYCRSLGNKWRVLPPRAQPLRCRAEVCTQHPVRRARALLSCMAREALGLRVYKMCASRCFSRCCALAVGGSAWLGLPSYCKVSNSIADANCPWDDNREGWTDPVQAGGLKLHMTCHPGTTCHQMMAIVVLIALLHLQ